MYCNLQDTKKHCNAKKVEKDQICVALKPCYQKIHLGVCILHAEHWLTEI